jgi:peptidoglycan/LPS O-acetylase OafA/YrhL
MAFYAFLLRQALPAAALGALRYLGDRSLEIYLLHQPLIRSYNVYFQTRWLGVAGLTPTGLIIGMAAGLAVTLVLSDGLHWLLKRLPTPAWLRASPAQGQAAARP